MQANRAFGTLLYTPVNRFWRVGRCVLSLLFADPLLKHYFRLLDRSTLKTYLLERFRHAFGNRRNGTLTDWYTGYRPGPALLRRFRNTTWPADAPFFSVLVRPTSTPFLQATLRSISNQTYPHFCCVRGDDIPVCPGPGHRDRPYYVCFINAGDMLEPHALHRLAFAVCRHAADVIYSDEAVVDADGETILALEARGAYSYDSFLTRNSIGPLLAVRAALLHQMPAALLSSSSRLAATELILRLLETAPSVSHVPDILYRRRQPDTDSNGPAPADEDALAELVRQHLQRTGTAAEVTPLGHGCRTIRFQLRSPWRVGIIIPTRNRRDLLEPCVNSLERTIDGNHADIIIVDHESSDSATLAYLRRVQERHRVLRHQGPFNFSAIINGAVARTAGEYTHYLLLNNDTEAISWGWLEHMMGYAQRPDVGVVSALLLYPNGTVQDAGVHVGAYFRACDAHNGVPAFAADGTRLPGPDGVLLAAREQSAATGACMLIRADVFTEAGGFDERIAVGFGDVDLCLRVRANGYRIIFDPQAVFIHHESATRGRTGTDPHRQDTRRFRRKHWQQISRGDLFYTPLRWRISPAQWNPFARSGKKVFPRTVRPVEDSRSPTI